MESSGQVDFRTVPGFDNWPRFVGVIEQNKIQRTYEHDCMWTIQYGVAATLHNISYVAMIQHRFYQRH